METTKLIELINSSSPQNIILAKELCTGLSLSFAKVVEEALTSDPSLADYDESTNFGMLLWRLVKGRLHIVCRLSCYRKDWYTLTVIVMEPHPLKPWKTGINKKVFHRDIEEFFHPPTQKQVEEEIRMRVFGMWFGRIIKRIETWM